MEILFWSSLFFVWYAYFGYPVLLYLLTLRKGADRDISVDERRMPSVTVLIPAHNEQEHIGKKIDNTLDLDYPDELLDIIIISDGSTDDTNHIIRGKLCPSIRFIELKERGGKAVALNYGLENSESEILVFSDASILLDKNALYQIIIRFQNDLIGCVSGEDHIVGDSGEGLYGKYELLLRNLESKFYSIIGASGSFYAQRRFLCKPFPEGLSPDFLSVLNTVEAGYIAVTEPSAFGNMVALKSNQAEFDRKVRTVIRGIAALFHKKHLLNPLQYPQFSLQLISHKLLRWLVPVFLTLMLFTNLFLLHSALGVFTLVLQVSFYLVSFFAHANLLGLKSRLVGKVPLYFITVNFAIMVAWYRFFKGIRQEIWDPSRR